MRAPKNGRITQFTDRPVVFLRKDHPLLQQKWSLENFLASSQISMVWEANDTRALDSLLEDEGLKREVPIMVAMLRAGAAYCLPVGP